MTDDQPFVYMLYILEREDESEEWEDADVQPYDFYDTRKEARTVKKQLEETNDSKLIKYSVKKEYAEFALSL